MPHKVMACIEEVLREAGLKPVREERLRPYRILILNGMSVDGSILAVHMDDDELVIEDMLRKRGGDRGLRRIPLGDPDACEKLVAAIRSLWKDWRMNITMINWMPR